MGTRLFHLFRFIRAGGAVVVAAVTVAGCAVPQSQDVKGRTLNVTEPITKGRYYLYLPADYAASRGHPLVVSIHGMKPFDNAFPQLMTWRKLCDENGWIALAPQLTSPDIGRQFPFRKVDDVLLDDEALIVAAVQAVLHDYSVDPRYVMLTGWSSGGYLIHFLGVRHPELFTLIAPQGSNFSEEIMPAYVPEAARRTPIYIYVGQSDLPLVARDTNDAVHWYYRKGYPFVQTDAAPGGHERHPELAARFFRGLIEGTNRRLTAQASAAPIKMQALAEPWLGQGLPWVPTTPAAASAGAGGDLSDRLTSAGPPWNAAANHDVPGWGFPDDRAASTISAGSYDAPVASCPEQSRHTYVWDKSGPVRVSVVAPAATTYHSCGLVGAGPGVAGGSAQKTEMPQPAGTETTAAYRRPPAVAAALVNSAAITRTAPSRSSSSQDRSERMPMTQGMTAGPRAVAAGATRGPARASPFGYANALPGPRPTPQVRIVPTVLQGYAPLTIEFRYDVRGINLPIVGCRWHMQSTMFGAQACQPATFQQPGNYPIDLTIFDSAGNAFHDRIVISVLGQAG